MHEVTHYGAIVLLVSGAFLVALLVNKLSERLRVPAAAFFLLAAALASDIWPRLGDALSIRDVERVAVAGADRDPVRRRHAGRLAAAFANPRCRSSRWVWSEPS